MLAKENDVAPTPTPMPEARELGKRQWPKPWTGKLRQPESKSVQRLPRIV